MRPACWQRGGYSESAVCVCVVGLGWGRQREPTAPSRLPPAPPFLYPDVRDGPGMFHRPAERWPLIPRDWGHFLPDATHSTSFCPTVVLKDRRGGWGASRYSGCGSMSLILCFRESGNSSIPLAKTVIFLHHTHSRFYSHQSSSLSNLTDFPFLSFVLDCR